MKKNLIIKVIAAALLMQSCSGQKEVVVQPGESSGKQILMDQNSSTAWKTQQKNVNDTTVISSKILTPEGRAASEQIMKETSLEPLNLPTDLNVDAYTMPSKSNVRTNQAVYLAPKLYFYSTKDGANVKPQKFGKNVVIPMHAILVDGLSREIPKPNGIDKMILPDSYLVNLATVTRALMQRGYPGSTPVGPLDGCAKSYKISAFGTTYDVTPETVMGSDYCQINRPFTLNLIVPENKADLIINEALHTNEIDGSASFEVKAGYLEADMHIQLDRSKIFEKLQASLQAQYPPYASAHLKLKLQSIIQIETMNIFIKGDRTDVINQLIQMAYDSFVVPYELKPGADQAQTDCSEKYACLDISYEKNKETRTLAVSYQQYSTAMTGKLITSFGKPQQILYPEVGFSSLDGSTENYISNLADHQNERPLLISVNSGSVLEVSLNKTTAQVDNTAVQISSSRSSRCASRAWDKRCEWTETFLHVSRSYPGIIFSEPTAVAGNVLGDPDKQLALRFTDSEGKEAVCSFSELNAVAKGTKYIVKLKNTTKCTIFSDELNKENQVSVRIINKLRDPKKLKQINNGIAFGYTDQFVGQDNPAVGDESLMGGSQPSSVTEAEREIKLDLTVMVRKYDLLTVE